ncbi:helix-turn-helix transcriptional regulator [Erythrobacter oryzae]|uniref:helix-turn-helix transcriptional regulator n=1 Tax=Erythrobacter oryzae TaxID=3019556 RepID=UPI0025531677|nr:WYL domain-containing protein [Erythrobacter sp. COR-2]
MKTARMIAILSRLQARGTATARELAEAHEVSVRTIYRDIDALSVAGFPVYGDAGPGGGFRLLDVPSERHTGLLADEAEAMLLLGLSGPAAALGLGTMAGIARDKLLLRLSGPARTRAVRLAERFHLDTDDWYRSAAALPHLPQLARAILDTRPVTFAYRSWTRARSWRVDPLGIVLKGGRYYLVAAAGQGPTTFAVAAMSALAVSQESFDRPHDFDLAEWWAQSLREFEARLRPHACRVVLTPTGAARLAEAGHYAAEAVAAGRETPEGLVVALPYETPDQAARLLLSLGAECRVVGPREVRACMAALVQAIAAGLAD